MYKFCELCFWWFNFKFIKYFIKRKFMKYIFRDPFLKFRSGHWKWYDPCTVALKTNFWVLNMRCSRNKTTKTTDQRAGWTTSTHFRILFANKSGFDVAALCGDRSKVSIVFKIHISYFHILTGLGAAACKYHGLWTAGRALNVFDTNFADLDLGWTTLTVIWY